jgi:hypothetical protein
MFAYVYMPSVTRARAAHAAAIERGMRDRLEMRGRYCLQEVIVNIAAHLARPTTEKNVAHK